MSLFDPDISAVDLRSAIDGIARRWRLVVLSVVVTVGIVFAQDSGLRSESAGRLVIEKKYEAFVELEELALVKIDPSAILPVPSLKNQIEILRSDDVLEELQTTTGVEGTLSVERSEPTFTVSETLDDEENRVSFLSTGAPLYTFRCSAAESSSCGDLLDAYVSKTTEMRKESIVGGLTAGLKLMDSLIASAEERLSSNDLTEQQRSAQVEELTSLLTKRDALQMVSSKVTGGMILVQEESFIEGKTTASVTATTYGFGLVVGLVIGLLIALQLTALDKTIRYPWHIRRINPNLRILGSVAMDADLTQSIGIAGALERAIRDGVESALILALDDSLVVQANNLLGANPQLPGFVVPSVEAITVDHVAGGPSRVVIALIKVGRTTRKDLLTAIEVVTAGGNRFLGVVLVAERQRA